MKHSKQSQEIISHAQRIVEISLERDEEIARKNKLLAEYAPHRFGQFRIPKNTVVRFPVRPMDD